MSQKTEAKRGEVWQPQSQTKRDVERRGALGGGASLPEQLLLNCTCLYLSCSDQVVLGVFWGGSNTCEPSEYLASWDLSAQGCCGLGEGAASWPALSLTCVAPDRHGWCSLWAAQQLL